eukprot:Opistho-1_new@45519
MGCSPSKEGAVAPAGGAPGASASNAAAAAAAANAPAKLRKKSYAVKIDVGQSILPEPDKGRPDVVFVFGGPGTCKGLILERLVDEYGFKLLSSEQLIMDGIKEKEAAKGQTLEETKQVFEFLRKEPWHLTLEFVLKIVGQHIEKEKNEHGILIDMLPNHKILFRNEEAVEKCAEEMDRFERRHFKCRFALNLIIPAERFDQALDINATARKTQAPPEPDKKDPNAKKEEAPATSDEADKSKTKRRYQAYVEASKPFVDYFEKQQRLVSVDVSTAPTDAVLDHVHKIFQGFKFNRAQKINTVALFSMDGVSMGGVDLTKMGLEHLPVKDILAKESKMDTDAGRAIAGAMGRNEPVPSTVMLHAVQAAMDRSRHAFGYVVDMTGVSLNKDTLNPGDPSIMFHDGRVDGLLRFNIDHPVANKIPLQAIYTTRSLVLVFARSVDKDLCMRVAQCMIEHNLHKAL